MGPHMGRPARVSEPTQRVPSGSATGSARSPHVLLIAWEYPGAHSRRGTALARRVGQVARGLAGLGWRVTVVHRQQRADDPAASTVVRDPTSGPHPVCRRAVAGPGADARARGWLMPLRKLSTLVTAVIHGDRSGRWAYRAIRSIRRGNLDPPDIAIAFFTPRGPLAVAATLCDQMGLPWIADLQDPWWEGTSRPLRPLVARWMRKTLRSAALVVQVSPEWATQDAVILRRPVTVLRHAVPPAPSRSRATQEGEDTGPFRILYVGSLKQEEGDIGPFMDAIRLVQEEPAVRRSVEVHIASSEESWRLFAQAAAARGITRAMRWLGWLDDAALRHTMTTAHCLLLVPMFPAHRQGVPSKLFEYLAYDPPVLIAGPDSGGMTSLLEEWAHPPVVAVTAQQIASAIRRACDGDASALLHRHRCGIAPLSEEALASWYSERMHRVLRAVRAQFMAPVEAA